MTAAAPRPELRRPVMVSRLGPDEVAVVVEATAPERAALAARMGLPAIVSLSCRFDLVRRGRSVVEATGRLAATVVQICVVSLEEFEAPIVETFAVRFVPAGTESDDPDPDSVDEVPYDGDTIDLGEAASEQLALALDPYPRRPDAQLPEQEAAAIDPRLAGLAARRGDGAP